MPDDSTSVSGNSMKKILVFGSSYRTFCMRMETFFTVSLPEYSPPGLQVPPRQ